MSEIVITNTPRAGETAEQASARTAPRGSDTAKIFVLTEESGRFFVTIQMKGAHGHTTARIEISRAQLVNVVADGAGMMARLCGWRAA